MRRTRSVIVAIASLALLIGGGAAIAHDGALHDGTRQENRHALHDFSHESEGDGHIEQDVNYGFEHVGNDTLAGVLDDHYTDVWSDGRGYAYVGSFQQPDCDRSGVYISDISDPSAPAMVGMIKSAPDTRVNDVKTIQIGQHTVLIHTEEPCGMLNPGTFDTIGQGGISLWNVTDPARPVALKQHFLDFGVHNTFPWTDEDSGRTYLIGVNNEQARDVFIADITRPQSPKLVAEVGLPDWPQALEDGQADPGMGAFQASFNHDVWVTDVGTDGSPSYEAVVSYWDAGFVRLDVTDPSSPTFIDDSTYPDPDPVTGFSPPEGNAHAAAYSSDASWILAGDEDFDAFRTEVTTDDGDTFVASQGSDVPRVEPDDPLTGSTVYVGLACSGLSSDLTASATGATIALVQRGDCAFTTKVENVQSAGYAAGIVFNEDSDRSTACDFTVSMLVEGDIPFLFVPRAAGMAILDVGAYDPADCGDGSTDALVPSAGAAGDDVTIDPDFDGWGYFHLLERTTLDEVGYYAPGQVNDPDYASGFGDLTMHNVEGDPTAANRAFISWYSLGMRAIEVDAGFSVRPPDDDWDAADPGLDDYYGQNVREVGRWIAPDGSNFWGLHVTQIDGDQYILGSDRNTGLHIFRFDPGE